MKICAWIVTHQEGLRVECTRCHATDQVELPAPTRDWIAMAGEFSALHADCQPLTSLLVHLNPSLLDSDRATAEMYVEAAFQEIRRIRRYDDALIEALEPFAELVRLQLVELEGKRVRGKGPTLAPVSDSMIRDMKRLVAATLKVLGERPASA